MESTTNQSSSPDGPAMGAQGTPEVGQELVGEMKQQASEIQEQAKAKARDVARSGQTAAADQLHQFAEGVRRSAENWDESQHAWVRQGLGSAADSLDRFSSTLRDRDIVDLAGDMEATARRHPLMFAAACALAGFTLVRFLRSSRRDMGQARSRYGSDPDLGRSSTDSRVSGSEPFGQRPGGYSSDAQRSNF